MFPFNLKPGGGIGILAPAGAVRPEQIEPALRMLENQGWRIKKSRHLYDVHRQYAGTPENRVADIHQLLSDPDVEILLAARGGAGSGRLLPYIDFDLWRESQKPLIGFSDCTALQWGVYKNTSLPSVSGMTLTSQLRDSNPYLPLFLKMVTGVVREMNLPVAADAEPREITRGHAQGVLLGGTLSIIITLLGTPYFPDADSVILFIEDINEPLYRLERALVQLRQNGFLQKVTGLILGRFDFQGNLLDIWPQLQDLFEPDIPVLADFPYGHFANCCPLPLGLPVKFSTNPFQLSW